MGKIIIEGAIIGIAVVVGPMGALATVDKLNGVDTPDVTVERINNTHAAVTWLTEKPTHAYVTTSVSRQCGPGGTTIDTINVSSLKRTHHIISPIHDSNKSQVNQTDIPGNRSPKYHEVGMLVMRNRSGATTSIMKRNLSQSCQ